MPARLPKDIARAVRDKRQLSLVRSRGRGEAVDGLSTSTRGRSRRWSTASIRSTRRIRTTWPRRSWPSRLTSARVCRSRARYRCHHGGGGDRGAVRGRPAAVPGPAERQQQREHAGRPTRKAPGRRSSADRGHERQTYSARSAYYVKVGRLVLVSFRAILSNKGTITTNADSGGCRSPPRTRAAASGSGLTIQYFNGMNTNWIALSADIGDNSTVATVYGTSAAAASVSTRRRPTSAT